jgi:sodium-dependent phosphate cotransporter
VTPLSERRAIFLRLGFLALILYGFFVGLDLLGLSFKMFGGDFAETLIAKTTNPFVGLFIGILATSLVQSSSTTTSIVVGLVAAQALTLEGAIPIVMGANVGTSVTNTLVSLGHVTRREEFRRAFAGATLHDFFNLLAVAIFLPLEMLTGYLARTSVICTRALEGVGGLNLLNPVKVVVRPVADALTHLLGDSAVLVLILGLVILIGSLKLLVDVLRALMTGAAEQILHRTLFRSALSAITAGAIITAMVQSSSITTSVMVPMVGSGIITLEQVFPFTLGANIGTTITAMLAALSTGSPVSVSVAFAHLIFNLAATLFIYGIPPLRRIPLYFARRLGALGARNRLAAAAYVGVVFFGIPLLLLLLSGVL